MVNTIYQHRCPEDQTAVSEETVPRNSDGGLRFLVNKGTCPLQYRSIQAVLGIGQSLTTADIGKIFVRAAPNCQESFVFQRSPDVMRTQKDLKLKFCSLKLTEISTTLFHFVTTHGRDDEEVLDASAWLKNSHLSNLYYQDGIKIAFDRILWDDDRWITCEAYAPFAEKINGASDSLPHIERQFTNDHKTEEICAIDGSLYVM
jgi:hypothetical protein